MSLIDRLPKIKGSYRENALLSKTNWFGVGGPAEVLYKPEDEKDLIEFLKHKPRDINITIIGVGSNIIVRDGGIEGVVIKLGRNFTNIKLIDETTIEVGAGALDIHLANFALENNIGGLEFYSGIPGTIGGAVAMNAGAYGVETSNVLVAAKAISIEGDEYNLTNNDFGFKYRGHNLADNLLFTSAIFKGKKDSFENIKKNMDQIKEKRESSQPIKNKTGGSTFANPAGLKAWELIDKAGCRGLVCGDAIVSEKHCNFLINRGNATASDLEKLGEEIKRRVKEASGVELEWEIKRIGKYIN